MAQVAAVRLWRIRRDSRQLEALVVALSGNRVELRFVLNGAHIYRCVWGSRERAVDFATEQLTEMQRKGWASHW